MDHAQYGAASVAIQNGCTTSGTLFDPNGDMCAIGGLFQAMHPTWGFRDLKHTADIYLLVGEYYGLSVDEVWEIVNTNDTYRFTSGRRIHVQEDLDRIFVEHDLDRIFAKAQED